MGLITPMAKIPAGVNELRASHIKLNSAAKANQGPPAHLLLFYAAECGLKYAQLKRMRLWTTEQLGDIDHDLNALIKSLSVPAIVLGSAPVLRLARGQNVPCPHSSAHQAWRYGVRIDADDEAKFVTWLQRICEVVGKDYL